MTNSPQANKIPSRFKILECTHPPALGGVFATRQSGPQFRGKVVFNRKGAAMIFNRRKHERIPVVDCMVQCSFGKRACTGQVLNLSEGGMRVDMEEVPAMHAEVSLSMTCENGRELNRKAVVVWFIKKVPPEVGAMVGLKFIS